MAMRSTTNSRAEGRRKPWTDPHSTATTLVTLFVDTYGTEGLNWDPQTIHAEISDDFGVELPTALYDRLMAGVAILTTDMFYKSLPDFIHLCNVLGGCIYDPTEFDPADAAECAWGITEAMLLSPPEDEDENPFSDDIVEYIAQAVKAEGMLNPPDILRLGLRSESQQVIDQINYDYSDDPEMSQAIWHMERSKTDDINNMIVARLRLLIKQVEALPLDNGNPDDLVKRLLSNLPKGGQEPATLSAPDTSRPDD